VATTLGLMGGSVLLAIHSALRVLPQFALIEPIGRHCPEAVLRRALKEGGLQPEEAAALAGQLGVSLPGSQSAAPSWRRLSLSSVASMEARHGDVPEERAARESRVAERLLGICAARAATLSNDGGSSDSEAPGAGGSGGGGARDGGRAAPPRRSLEGIKSASVGQLLNLLAEQPSVVRPWLLQGGGSAEVGGNACAPESPSSSAAPTPHTRAAAATVAASCSSPANLQRTSLAASLPGSHVGPSPGRVGGAGAAATGASGAGHGGLREPSSNVELAGEMLRAIILKQARAEQAGVTGGHSTDA
jgi:hypothetical protein